jgi:hypothetical protein
MKTGSLEVTMSKKSLVSLILRDNKLKTLFSGMLISLVFLVSLAVTASAWYL